MAQGVCRSAFIKGQYHALAQGVGLAGQHKTGRQLGLVEQDYAWITQRIKDVARRHAKGRIVSCLEGGYHLGALARSVAAHLRVLAGL
jgi:acetoin utilization deacetylase AcuC-like enzyme